MNLYEMTYILRSDADDEAVSAVNERISARVQGGEGEMLKTEGWGRRRLAFPIDRVREGFYFTSVMRMPGNAVRSFEAQLRLMPEVLRFLVIQQDEENINLEGSLLPAAHRPAVAAQAATPAAEAGVGEDSAAAGDASSPTEEPEGTPETSVEPATDQTDGGETVAEAAPEVVESESAEDQPSAEIGDGAETAESAGSEAESEDTTDVSEEPASADEESADESGDSPPDEEGATVESEPAQEEEA